MLFKKWYPILTALALLLLQQARGQNYALSLAPNQEDFINLDVSATPLAGNAGTLTVECWFNYQNTNIAQFRRLFSFGGGNSRIEVGVLGGQLVYFFRGTGGDTGVNNVTAVSLNTWYHLAVVKNGDQFDFYLDCTPVGSTVSTTGITFNNDYFRLGRWPGGVAMNADWHGLVDDLRLWQTALSPTDICARQYCPLSCNEPGLVAYWDFNDPAVVPSGNNTGITQVLDCSPNANHGTPVNLLQTGPTSNWVNSTAPVVYPALHDLTLEIRDYPYQNNLLTGICDGDPVQVCLDDNGLIPGPYSNVTVQWEFSDDGGSSWATVGTPSFLDFCFPVLPAEIQVPCPGNTDGFVDRKYRAISTATGPTGEQCDYVSNEYDLQICCPITGANLTVVPGGPFCEGDLVNFQVDLNPFDPFVATPGPNVTIDWCFVDPIGRTPLPAYANQTSFNYPTWTAPFPPGGTPGSYCFEAKVSNCQGKLATFQKCVTVDPQPVCGTIEGSPLGSPMNLTLLSSSPLVYEICPGNDARLEMATPFLYCIPQWQYTFTDPAVATPADWVNMGLSNTTQNTNILPSHLWPAGQTSIYYRIQCNPLSNPSACNPCFSNIVEIQLKPAPAVPVIAGLNQVCLENLPLVLTISNPDPALSYTWYHDGLVVGSGTSLTISEGGCYWVEATDGCHTVVSAQHCVEVCETIARLSCPLPPNACATPGEPISLTACGSENTCSGTAGLLFEWFVDGVSQGTASSLCDFTHTPATTGTTYKVVVTDPATGCMDMVEQTVIPCDAN